jgi:hypothetical protein
MPLPDLPDADLLTTLAGYQHTITCLRGTPGVIPEPLEGLRERRQQYQEEAIRRGLIPTTKEATHASRS